ncbi:MAG: DUF1295 domain-containing protein [Treponema sp.]
MTYSVYCAIEITMLIIGAICFITLYFIPAGYGKTIGKKWGVSFNNKPAWILMEIPALLVTFFIICTFDYRYPSVRIALAGFYILHYIQRTLIFPFLLKGKSKMPLVIVMMGMLFNTVNAYLIGLWIFHFSQPDFYTSAWFFDPRFITGSVLFCCGMFINIRSDSYIRSLRKAGDSKHYYPCRGLYRFVTSANYFGELIEWLGFAILTWSPPGFLFVFWTACNLVPRSDTIYKKYAQDFPQEFSHYKPKRIIPFMY